MADPEEVTREREPGKIQDFIFQRELCEVYLLLDYLSGRSNQSLAAALADEKGGKVSIEEICDISWPPDGSKLEQAKQAAKLLLAKDKLNMAARPASGESIAFTLLVTGDDGSPKPLQPERHGPRAWLERLFFGRSRAAAPAPAASAAVGGAPPPPPPPGGGGGGGNTWSGGAPSRTSLARAAYPGLIGRAGRFYYATIGIITLLFVWLILTCLLSWNVAAGRAMVNRLDAVEKDRQAIRTKIKEVEPAVVAAQLAASPAPAQVTGSQAPTPAPAAGGSAPNPAPATAAPAPSRPVQQYCEQYRLLPLAKNEDNTVQLRQYTNAIQLQLCEQWQENRLQYASACEHAGDWLVFWRRVGVSRTPKYENACEPATAENAGEMLGIRRESISEHQRASVLVEILATAVLPIFYGFLGAGAAAVRDIWSKMRDFLLLPRDMTLSLGRLALGAVIGACIGLFVSPSGTASQTGPALTTAVTLTPSALSFIAGFGVEGIFVALEGFIKRVFNIPDPRSPTPP